MRGLPPLSLVDQGRQFFKAATGEATELAAIRQQSLNHSVCRHVVKTGIPLVAANTRDYPEIDWPDAVAYLGIPLLTRDGLVLGSFCVIDVAPRIWSDDEVTTMTDLAASVGTEIELRLDIARRAELERALSVATRRFESYMRHRSPRWFTRRIKRVGLTYLNERFERVWGRDSDDWLGKSRPRDLSPGGRRIRSEPTTSASGKPTRRSSSSRKPSTRMAANRAGFR